MGQDSTRIHLKEEKINKFELFCMIYYVLDIAWDKSKNMKLERFLTGANPFLFKDLSSADPAVYGDFCEKIPNIIMIKNSYSVAKDYVESLNNTDVYLSFLAVDEEEWIKGIKKYLSKPHKGGKERG